MIICDESLRSLLVFFKLFWQWLEFAKDVICQENL